MQKQASVKIGVAFLAGVAMALGGAFFYLRSSERDLHPVLQIPSAAEPATVAEAKPVDTPAPSEPTSPPVPITPTQIKPAIAITKKVAVKTRRPVSLAVWRPQAEPVHEQAAQLEPPMPVVDALADTPAAVPDSGMPETAAAPAAAPVRQPHTVTIPAGTTLVVRVNEKLSTEHNFNGDTFRATLDAPVIMGGFIIADRGAKVLGRVVRSQQAGRMQGLAELSLVLTEVATTDSQRVALETNESLRKGPSNRNEEVVKMAGGAALGAIIGAIAGGGKGAAIGAGAGGAAGTGAVLLGRGKPAVIENETQLSFELATPTTITEHLN